MGNRIPAPYSPPGVITRPPWLLWLPLFALLLCAVLERAFPQVSLVFLAAFAPLLATIACSAMLTTVYGVAATAEAAVLYHFDDFTCSMGMRGRNELALIAGVGAASVLLTLRRRRYDRRITRIGNVAEAAQYAVLPRLPARVGDVECSALYRSAQIGAMVGGDLYDVRDTPYGVRAIVGDVKGHGLEAVSTMAALLGTFREAVLDLPSLADVAGRLERRMTVDNAARDAELFATAVLIGFAPGEVEVVLCGHPSPFRLTGGSVARLGGDPSPPLGLGDLAAGPPMAVRTPLAPGDVLLACTDGVLESRDAFGRFYPLERRLRTFLVGRRPPLSRLTMGVWDDLRDFTGEPADDIAMLALRPVTPGR
ncbi:membrane protein [Actinorhabdospora filicis]|uniref:Membrane protein n=1 Tax=Actinorhabdospora filicis TaxID=1785913 RepID=A0A9W6SNM5_9ACTN|nr:PP2C family protein-serine/threonine phosphatase [Actinorhabdospora filicis]GLZ79288.1 membrane protein [Actinorhabdospora filicis]